MRARRAWRSHGGDTSRLGCAVAISRAKPCRRWSSKAYKIRALCGTCARVAGLAFRRMGVRVEDREQGEPPGELKRSVAWGGREREALAEAIGGGH